MNKHIHLYGRGTHTFKLSQAANTLNYVLHGASSDSIMLGLKHVVGDLAGYMSGIELDGHFFTVCTVKEDVERRRWESDECEKAEQDLIDKGYVWLVSMPGCDDHHGYTRFKSLEEAKLWYISDEPINYSDDRYWTVN